LKKGNHVGKTEQLSMKLAELLQSKILAKKNEQEAQFKAQRETRRHKKL